MDTKDTSTLDLQVTCESQRRHLWVIFDHKSSTCSYRYVSGRPNDGIAAICTLEYFINFLLFTLISCSSGPDHSCWSNIDWPTYESCCGNVCKRDHYCLGNSCYSDSDCGIYGSCCVSATLTSDRKCRQNCTSDLFSRL